MVDLVRGRSAPWPAPTAAILVDGGPRRRFLRVATRERPDLAEAIEAHLRRDGLEVRARAIRRAGEELWHGFVMDAAEERVLRGAVTRLAAMERVPSTWDAPIAG